MATKFAERRKGDTPVKVLHKYVNQRLDKKVSSKLFGKIYIQFWNRAMHEIVLQGGIVNLPNGLGNVHLKRREPKVELDDNFRIKSTTAAVNWRATNELIATNPDLPVGRRRVFHENLETHGVIYSIRWDRKAALMLGKTAYYFSPVRRAQRTLTVILKNNGNFLHECSRDIREG